MRYLIVIKFQRELKDLIELKQINEVQTLKMRRNSIFFQEEEERSCVRAMISRLYTGAIFILNFHALERTRLKELEKTCRNRNCENLKDRIFCS